MLECRPKYYKRYSYHSKTNPHEEKNTIDLSRALSQEFRGGNSFYEYLRGIGDEDPFKFVVDGIGFQADTFEMTVGKTRVSPDLDAPGFYLPQEFDVNNGDLFIMYQNFLSGKINIANLFYFQQKNAKHGNDIVSAVDILSNVDRSSFVHEGWFLNGRSSVCSTWDGIPA